MNAKSTRPGGRQAAENRGAFDRDQKQDDRPMPVRRYPMRERAKFADDFWVVLAGWGLLSPFQN